MTSDLQKERIFIVISSIKILIRNRLRFKAVKEVEIYEKNIALEKINDINMRRRSLSQLNNNNKIAISISQNKIKRYI